MYTGCLVQIVGLIHILWEVIGKTRGLRDGQEDLGPAVTVCGMVKVMVCGDFSRQANGDTFN